MHSDLRPRKERKRAVATASVPRTTLSFYKYVRIDDPEALCNELFSVWSALGCLGRIYLAHEGINAQMSVPTAHFGEFEAYMRSHELFSDVPFKIAVEEGDVPSFYKLSIKTREKIVADGLNDTSFDVTNTGEYLSAEEMNEYIDDPDAVVVDMRNAYESEIGHFENAITPEVETFREELAVVPALLRVHKNKKIALYCTGGIRCEKASAWLKHNGFTNVRHLKGGIIDYAHQVKAKGLPNRFRGKNFVFDERLGERIGEEVISTCHLCNTEKSDTHYHCKNQVCHVLYLGCDGCVAGKQGYCSTLCRLLDQLPATPKRLYARLYNAYFRPTQFKKTRLRV
ncbi:MAG: rhodanese-related sulfurtransferase [Candidatus Paceibacterota bacterium]